MQVCYNVLQQVVGVPKIKRFESSTKGVILCCGAAATAAAAAAGKTLTGSASCRLASIQDVVGR